MIEQKQNKKDGYNPLFQELNISDYVKSTAGKNKKETLEAVSPFDVLDLLLQNKVVSEDAIRCVVQELRRIKQTVKENGKATTDANGVGKVDLANTDSNAKNDSTDKKTLSGQDSQNLALAVNNPADQTRSRHVALRFFYDGASYSGLAQNIGQETDNSVERCLFDALIKARLIVSRETSNYSRCGRTDRGVSAAGQVVALQIKSAFPKNASWDENGTSLLEAKDLPKNEHESRKVWTVPRSKKGKKKRNDGSDATTTTTPPRKRTEREINEYSYSKILNNLLPPSIRVLGWTPVTEEFSARFSASARTYRYFFCKRRMDTDSIQKGLNRLVGKHDFRNLCKMDVEKVYNFERVIHSAELVPFQESSTTSTQNAEVCYLKIIGQAFLWHQIRCIAEVLFMIGNGYESPSIITELLDVKTNPGKPSYSLADEKPLVLHDCAYPNLQFGHSVQNLWTVSCQLEKQWEDLIMAAARLRSFVRSLGTCSILTEDVTEFSNTKLRERSKKLKKRGILGDNDVIDPTDNEDPLLSSKVISWADGLAWLEKRNLVPNPTGVTNSVHVPLMQRSMGPTYEEKVENLKKSEKRRLKFEENTIKKRKTREEDKAFYEHKIKQGGTGI